MVGKSEVRRILVSYESSSGSKESGVARDASLGGLFIETKTPLPVGTLLTVELGSGASVTLDARVISVRSRPEGAEAPAGMAVCFLDLPADAQGQLQALLDRHRPPERTRLGVGEDRAPTWSSPPAPGGGSEMPPAPGASVAAAAPPPPRAPHAAAPMAPAARGGAPPLPGSPQSPRPLPRTGPPPAPIGVVLGPPPSRRLGAVVALVAVIVLLAVLGVLVALSRR